MRKAFTLIELLVVVSIIALLIAILLPALRGSQHETKRMICKSNMRQSAIALTSYAVDNDGLYPDAPWGRWQPADIARQETEGHGTQGAGDYDHRDIIRSYSGAQLNDILKCPLADPWWFEDEDGNSYQNIDEYNMGALPRVKSTYTFFYGGLAQNAASNGRWPRDQAMVGLDKGFIPKDTDMEFDILLSDFTKAVGWGGPKLYTMHQPVGARKSGGNLDHANYATMYLPGEKASANFARTDGSVEAYWLDYDAAVSDDYVDMKGFILPADMAK